MSSTGTPFTSNIAANASSLNSGNGLLAQYFNDKGLTNLKLTRTDPTIDFSWGTGSPDSSVSHDNFSARWTGQVQAKYSETYTFETVSDDGVRLWVNGKQLINDWQNHSTKTDTGSIALLSGQKYDIKLEYYENTGEAVSKLLWSSTNQTKEIIPTNQLFTPKTTPTATPALTGNGTGLKAEYYDSGNLTNLKLTRTDATVNFDWGSGSPDASIAPDTFSARWTGQVQSKTSGAYTFYTNSDDGVRLWVNGQQLINNWTNHAATENSGTINLTAGQKYDIKLEYYDRYNSAEVRLSWSSASQPKQIVPQSQLFAPPANPTPTPTPTPIPTPTPAPTPTPPGAIALNVNWNTVQDKITGLEYGLNAYQGFRSSNASDSAYGKNLDYMHPGLLRYHNVNAMNDSSTVDGLVDTVHKTWDTQKVVNALMASEAAFGNAQPERMINIPSWPSWMTDSNGYLDPNQYDNYAKFCADLVKIVNKDHNLNVKYWEITNEQDGPYFTKFHSNGGWGGLIDPNTPDRVKDLITIYNKVAVAIKQVDPTVEVGGAAIARSDLAPFYVPFIQGTAKNLDFFSYHIYATGSASTPDSNVYATTNSIGNFTKKIVQALDETSPGRHIPAFLDEYNISWTWQTHDPRMINNKGAVFDALSIVKAIQSGADGTTAWNEKDDIYGKTNNQDVLRPGANLLHLFNEYMIGDEVTATSSNDDAVTTFAVKNAVTGHKELLVINHSDKSQAIQGNFSGWQPMQTSINETEIAAGGYTEAKTDWNAIKNGTFTVPDFSVTLLDFAG